MTLGLSNPISERLLNKYLHDGDFIRVSWGLGKWNDLLINMWSSFIDSSQSLSLEENEAILTFVRRCVSFIYKCIQYNIIQVNEHSPDVASCNHKIRWNSVLELPLPDTATTVKSTVETDEVSYDNDRETTASELHTSTSFSLVPNIVPIYD